MNNVILDKTYYVELLIAASSTAQQIYFPVLQVLDNKVTQGIETFNPVDLVKTVNNIAAANMPLLRVSYLNLAVGDVNQIWNLPLISLINVRNGTAAAVSSFNSYKNELNNLKVIWAKSFVFIADVTAIAASVQAYHFSIAYTDPTN